MRRDLPALLDSTFDLLVVGAGIHGAAIAWDAKLGRDPLRQEAEIDEVLRDTQIPSEIPPG